MTPMTPEEAQRWIQEGKRQEAYLNYMPAVHCKPSLTWTPKQSPPNPARGEAGTAISKTPTISTPHPAPACTATSQNGAKHDHLRRHDPTGKSTVPRNVV